jgi:2-polyprenyl-3-methyl-5-hydroxy-6-metoxy-1,4-benzoquinol methylase
MNACDANVRLQATCHPLVEDRHFATLESYVIYLMHLKAYEEAAGLIAGKCVLDWGCNTGYGMKTLAGRAAAVFGLDLSPTAIAAARQRVGAVVAEIQLYDGNRCGYESQQFDAVTSFQVIEHVSDHNTYFGEIQRVLKPDGIAVFTTPNAALRLDPGMKPWNKFHTREFRASEFDEFLRNWFPEVTVRGLFATAEVYSVERGRTEAARLAARSRGSRGTAGRQLRALAGKSLQLLRGAVHAHGKSVQEAFAASTDDFFYRDDMLDEALDFMAICRGAAT